MTLPWWSAALAAGILLAIMAGPLGSFVVWRRMAFFGDTLAHGALLGVTLGVLTDIDPLLALVLGCVVLALLLLPLQRSSRVSSDTLLGIVSHSTLALGMVALSLAEGIRVDMMGYLFGDLLAVGQRDVLWMALAALVVCALLAWQWRGLVAVTVSAELAAMDGYPAQRLNVLLVVLLALVVALAMKVVGILLVSALLIIPAATARSLASTPVQMALGAIVIGVFAVIAGLLASFYWDTPAGPGVVVAAASVFVVSLLRRPVAS